jgi:hypothetical protein
MLGDGRAARHGRRSFPLPTCRLSRGPGATWLRHSPLRIAPGRAGLTLVMVEPKCECTPTSSSCGSARMASRNHLMCELRMPNLLLARPVDTYECTCAWKSWGLLLLRRVTNLGWTYNCKGS